MFSGNYDVIVTDGFTGNVALKSIEGVAGVIKHFIKSEFKKNLYNHSKGKWNPEEKAIDKVNIIEKIKIFLSIDENLIA